MSRSNPSADGTPHPCSRWFEWNGEGGIVRYYDRTKKENIDVGPKMRFLLLDQTATVKGWNEASESAIMSNEVRDTRAQPMIVKSFKGGVIAEGFYAAIRDRVTAAGGSFTSNLYLAFKDETQKLALGCLQIKGAAMHAWVEFSRQNRVELYKQGISITGFTEGKKGKVIFRVPIFEITPCSEASAIEATAIDEKLQEYLKSYFTRRTTEQAPAAPTQPDAPEQFDQEPPPEEEPAYEAPPEEDDVPFRSLPPQRLQRLITGVSIRLA